MLLSKATYNTFRLYIFISKRALLRVGFIISLHFEFTGVIAHVLPYVLSLFLSLSLSSLSLSLLSLSHLLSLSLSLSLSVCVRVHAGSDCGRSRLACVRETVCLSEISCFIALFSFLSGKGLAKGFFIPLTSVSEWG